MTTLGPVFFLLTVAALYCVVGPLLFVVALRIVLALAGAFGVSDAIGRFSADVNRAYHSSRRMLDREFGAQSQT
jgi:hypothetical protein